MTSASPAFHSPTIDLIGIGPLWTGFSQPGFSPDPSGVKVQCHGGVLWLGIGCIRGTEKAVIDRAIRDVFKRYHLSLAAIAGIATLDSCWQTVIMVLKMGTLVFNSIQNYI